MKTLLAVDVGGTKIELALFDLRGRGLEPQRRLVAQCAGSAGFEEILGGYLRDIGARPDVACLGVAGVVADGTARITNLPWRMAEADLAAEFGFAGVKLINDMTALCAGLSSLGSHDLLTLQEGQGRKDGTRAVIAPGTGLGEGYLIETGAVFLPTGSEGGHADFAPADDQQLELLRWLGRRKRPVSYEMLCSGLGIPTLYAFCREQGIFAETASIREQLQAVRDATPVILGGAISEAPCPLCRTTIELFLSILGSEAGNLVLKLYAMGGLYLGGGLLPRLVDRIPFSGLLAAFRRKEKMTELMAKVPIRLILKRDAVLCGAAAFGRRFFLPLC